MTRNLVGYGATPPAAHWPHGARIAVQFVINYEEGAENTVLNGDELSEGFLSEMVGAARHPDRAMAMESLYEYGSGRASGGCTAFCGTRSAGDGVWRGPGSGHQP
jgi:peptidoglycan/xylan/chitin deacetylase (PgdA/CDA1 family)